MASLATQCNDLEYMGCTALERSCLWDKGSAWGAAFHVCHFQKTRLASCDWSPDIAELLSKKLLMLSWECWCWRVLFWSLTDCHPHSPGGIITPWLVLVDLYQD